MLAYGRPILVVEDDGAIRSAVSAALDMSGHRARFAADGCEGVRLIGQQRPSLVLLDMRMPVRDGWGFAREIRARGYDPPILVMTTRNEAEKNAREIGAVGFIGKPFDLTDLLNKVDQYRIP